jgi:predicted phosphate transport protein (TIGR00153 family)
MKSRILKHSEETDRQFDEFLDNVSEAGVLFREATENFFEGDLEAFEEKRNKMNDLEHRGDALRRSLEHLLYTKTLVPASRGDIMELLENMDALLDHYKAVIWRFDIERPDILPEFHDDFRELIASGVNAVECTVRSCKAFFRQIDETCNHMHKVIFWESEGDIISTRLQKRIFRNENLRLSH